MQVKMPRQCRSCAADDTRFSVFQIDAQRSATEVTDQQRTCDAHLGMHGFQIGFIRHVQQGQPETMPTIFKGNPSMAGATVSCWHAPPPSLQGMLALWHCGRLSTRCDNGNPTFSACFLVQATTSVYPVPNFCIVLYCAQSDLQIPRITCQFLCLELRLNLCTNRMITSDEESQKYPIEFFKTNIHEAWHGNSVSNFTKAC